MTDAAEKPVPTGLPETEGSRVSLDQPLREGTESTPGEAKPPKPGDRRVTPPTAELDRTAVVRDPYARWCGRGGAARPPPTGHPLPSIEGPATFSSREDPPMTSNPSDRPVSPLRARMIEDMTVRGFTEKTRSDYVRHVRAFAAFIGRSPDTATAEDIRRFQLHQAQSGMQPPSINSAVSALRFFFTVTLDRPDLARRLTVVREPRRLPTVLSVEEVARLLAGGAGAQVQGGARHRLWRRAARLRGGRAQGRRHRQRAHAAAGRAGQGPQGPPRHAVAAAARTAARLVARGPAARRHAAAGLAVSRPQPDRADHDPPAQPRRPCGRRGRRDQEARVAAYAAAQLRHPSARAGHRYPRHPGSARSRDILPANTRSRGGSTIRSIPGAARPCSLSGNTPTVALSWSSFRSLTGRSPASPRG